MSDHKKYSSIKPVSADAFQQELEKYAADVPYSESYDILAQPLIIGQHTLPNRLAIQPMEGCDGDEHGNPTELVYRRYRRFASGGAGLLWFEATAVVHQGRANPRQLYIHSGNVNAFHKLREESSQAAREKYGDAHKPYTVLQLTHSGRYSRPVNTPFPIIASVNPYLDSRLPESYRLITDEELGELINAYVTAASCARDAGFDAVDIKSCHRYLISELLSAHTRDGKYGGTFENRVRFLLDTIDAVQAHVPEIDIAVRLNVYDAIPYPYGWGVAEGGVDPNPAEPQYLAKLLAGHGAKLINVTAGNPYYNPHVNRPYDIGPYVPPEHPLEGMARLLRFAHNMQNAVPDIPVVATGFTWPREHGAAIAAGCIENGWCAVAGFGRQAFAYPDFAHDILLHGGMDAGKCCITCTKCSEIMRFGGRSGCVVHDREVYLPIYKEVSAGKPSQVGTEVRSHII